MPSELLLTASRTLALQTYEEPSLGADEVRAEAIVSGISHGTELALFRGGSPFGSKRFDPELRLFEDAAEAERYPIGLGYEWIGKVTEVGAEVQRPAVGHLVQLALPHRETHTFSPGGARVHWSVVPRDLDPERATLLQSVTIALQAVHDARLKVGDRVAVFGLGTFGLLAVQLARLSGAGWIAAVDPVEQRRALAQELGADLTLDPATSDAGRELKLATGRTGVDVAIEFSGRYAALQDALRGACLAGTVVSAGYYVGEGTELRLGEEWHHNRLTLVSSMSGWNAPHRDPGWDRARLRESALQLLSSDQLEVDRLLTHRIPFSRAAEAYELIDRNPAETLRVVLTY